jgi:lipopolysaccharide/colanic/teichoic acid biosynthesis glycosyltransferase
MKRTLDFVISGLAILVLSPLLIVVAAAVKAASPGPIFFRQERIGRDFHPFKIYKFRSMIKEAPTKGTAITFGDDPRITRLGRLLRKTKVDELPQLINVLKGDMSLVGPRPEIPKYVEMFRADYEIILQVRPGITDLASIIYRDEAALLGQAQDPEEEYVKRILPEKIRLAKEYVDNASILLDFKIIIQTVLKLLADKLAFSRVKTSDLLL